MKRQLLLFSILFLSLISLQARSFVLDGINYEITSIVSPYSLSVTSGVDYSGDIVIPSTVIHNDTTFSVTSIYTNAFSGSSDLSSVTIPNSVSSIGSQAFYNCTGLATVIIGDTANIGTKAGISIQTTAFTGCTGLITLSLNIPLTSYNYPFQNLTSLKTLAIGNSVPTIENSTFSSLTGLTKVILGRPDLSLSTISVFVGAFDKSIGLDTLNLNCNLQILGYSNGALSPFSKISTLSVGDRVTFIGNYAFLAAKKLKRVNIPNSVTTLGISTFTDCTFMSEITLGSSVMQLGSQVFSGCSSLLNIHVNEANTTYSSINGVLFTKDQLTLILYPRARTGDYEIPVPVKIIGANAFQFCNKLQSFAIPQSITTIQASAFANCINLKSVSIGHADSISTAVVSIASNSFMSCIGITKFILNKSFTFTSGDNSPFKNLTSVTTVQIGNGVVSIPDYALSGCTGLSLIQLGQSSGTNNNSITVSSNAFSGCTSFKTLELNRSISIVGYQSTFATISNLVVGDGVTFIGDMTFRESNNLTSVTLPTSVTKIGNGAFYYCSKIQSITFPGVNSIGSNAFWGCSALASISIPDAVKNIPTCTFYECTGLSSVTLGDSIIQIASSAFYGCNHLSSIVIPNLVKSIDENAFKNCSGLTSVSLGTSLTSIGTYAFSGCAAFQNIQFPGTLTSIADYAFENCKGLLSLFIPSTIKTIGGNAFANCSSIATLTIGDAGNPGSALTCSTYPFSGCTGVKTLFYNKDITNDLYSSPFMSLTQLESVTISNRVTHLNTFAFYGCSKLISVIIPNSVAAIGEAAFQGCTSLTDVKLPVGLNFLHNQIFYGCNNLRSLDIPSNVTFIGSSAFYQCSSLTTLTIPKTVILIGPVAFNGCSGLSELIAANPLPATTGINCFVGINATTCKLYVPVDSKSAYQLADNWKDFANIYEKDIQDSIQSPDSISGFISKTVNITLGGLTDALTSTELATVNKLTIVGSMNATDLSKIRSMPALYMLDMEKATIQNNTISSNAFSGMKSLLSITFPSTITSIGTRAFENCSGLIYITFTSDNTSIESNAFVNCSGLMMVTLPTSITTIKSSVFYDCSRLFKINIPSSVTTIEGNAFAKCTGFTSINLPNSITSIGEYAFAGCYGLRSFTIPPLVKIIPGALFIDCYSLESVHLPPSLTTIGSGVFSNCRKLKAIYNYQATPIVLTAYEIIDFSYVNTCVLYVPAGSLNAYRQAPVWNYFTNIREMTNTDVNMQIVPSLSFYPNPVKVGFHINGLTDNGILTLTNLNGSVLFTKQVADNEYISISTLPEGIYIAKIASNNFSIERKILKR